MLNPIIQLDCVRFIAEVNHNHMLDRVLYHGEINDFSFIQFLIDVDSDYKQAIDLTKFYNISTAYKNSLLFTYGYKLNSISKQKLIGRDYEVKICNILLNRKHKNNLIIVGSAGVGKTAIVLELSKFNSDDIIAIEINKVISGTKYRGEFEERISQIINDAIRFKKTLFIDEIHTLINCGGSEGGVSANNILKPYLTMDGFRLIGATTLEEYQNLVSDKAFERRFNIFKLSEPSRSALLQIIKAHFPILHNLIDVAIYDDLFGFLDNFQNRHYPDKLLDFFDLWHAYNQSENTMMNIREIKELFLLCSY